MNRPKVSAISPPVDLALLFVPCKLYSNSIGMQKLTIVGTPVDSAAPVKVPPPVPSRARKTSANLTAAQKPVKHVDEVEPPIRGSASRQSLPARFPTNTNPFFSDLRRASPEKKPRSKSVAFDDSDSDSDSDSDETSVPPKVDGLTHSTSNPFRQRQVSVPTIIARPPPIPPRKTSTAGDSPRRNKRVPSVSSVNSLLSHNTSGPRATGLIQTSLSAAAAQSSSSRKSGPSLHVIQQSTGGSSTGSTNTPRITSSSRNADLIRRVSEAVKESEEETPQPPPRRAASSRSKSRIHQLAKPFLDQDPDLTPWTCVDLIQGIAGERPYAMIILNQPITRKDVFLRAWSASKLIGPDLFFKLTHGHLALMCGRRGKQALRSVQC
jgi:hypothetical protein